MLTGARQVGKTSLLLHLFPDASYITLVDPFSAAAAQDDPENFILSLKSPVILDEAQYAPELFRHLKIFIDKNKKPGQYIRTGSQKFPLMQHASESLAGRIGVIELLPLSYAEIKRKKNALSIEDYMVNGGYPAIHGEGIPPKVLYPSYVSAYIERDIRNLLHVQNLRDSSRFLRSIALRSGQILSFSDIAKDVGIAPNTAKAWISILETSGLIVLVEGFYSNQNKRIIKSPKLYFNDTGLLLYLLGIDSWEQLSSSPLLDPVWESYAFTQIYAAMIKLQISPRMISYWRTKDGKEVDFIIDKGTRLIAIECKSKSLPDISDEKGLTAFCNSNQGKKIDRVIFCKSKGFIKNQKTGLIIDNGLNIEKVLMGTQNS
jgi:hypothetical protein